MKLEMMCVGTWEIKPHVYLKFMEKNKGIHTNGLLENRFMYLYSCFFYYDVTNVSFAYTKYKASRYCVLIKSAIHFSFSMRMLLNT